MAAVVAFAFLAGILTILSPCTLPVVPMVAGVTSAGGRHRLAGLILGFGAVFMVVTIAIASLLAALDITTDRLRVLSAVLIAFFGATLVVPRLGRAVEVRLAPLARLGSVIAPRAAHDGLAGGVVLGAAIGFIWAPCVGPIMAAAIAAATTTGPSLETLVIASAYVAGAAVPLTIVGRWGRTASRRIGNPARRAGALRTFGALSIAAALLVATGLDVPVQAGLSSLLPAGWSGVISSIEEQPLVQKEAALLRSRPSTANGSEARTTLGSDGDPLPVPVASSLPGSVALEELGPAPELRDISAWINSEPLTIASLRHKVVLVHFWTFGCINCIHVQPYVKAWYERYQNAGFVVVGIHTPELSFERDIDNVRAAVAKADVRFPVAVDPSFGTWDAYRNSYWPAFYFVDRAGRIRHVHFGEGDYEGSEQVIRELLAET